MREHELRRILQSAGLAASLLAVSAMMPTTVSAQTPTTDPAVTQTVNDDRDDDGMDMGWIGLLGLAGLLGLRRRDNADRYTGPTTPRQP